MQKSRSLVETLVQQETLALEFSEVAPSLKSAVTFLINKINKVFYDEISESIFFR